MAKRANRQGKLHPTSPHRSHSSFFKSILDWAAPRGWTVEGRRSHGIKWRHESGGIYFSQIFCEDTRGLKNAKAQMRRIEAGAEAPAS